MSSCELSYEAMNNPSKQELDPRLEQRQTKRCREAIVVGIVSMVAGLFPCGILFANATGNGLRDMVNFASVTSLLLTFPLGIYCGQLGGWLTRNSTLDSRLLACALALLLEFFILGWLIVFTIERQY